MRQDAVVLSTFQKPIILIIARQKPNSTTGSFLIEGLIRSLLNVNNKEKVIELLILCELHIVPMINCDGVIVGNTALSLAGVYLNSHWSSGQVADQSMPEL